MPALALNVRCSLQTAVAMQELEIKATELEEMRLSRDAMVASAEKEQDTVKKLRAEIAQLHADKVLPFT